MPYDPSNLTPEHSLTTTPEPPRPRPVNLIDWFERDPGGGTIFVDPAKRRHESEKEILE